MSVVMRQPTLTAALASAGRLRRRHGALFAITEDRSPSGGGDEYPYVVIGVAGYLDRR